MFLRSSELLSDITPLRLVGTSAPHLADAEIEPPTCVLASERSQGDRIVRGLPWPPKCRNSARARRRTSLGVPAPCRAFLSVLESRGSWLAALLDRRPLTGTRAIDFPGP